MAEITVSILCEWMKGRPMKLTAGRPAFTSRSELRLYQPGITVLPGVIFLARRADARSFIQDISSRQEQKDKAFCLISCEDGISENEILYGADRDSGLRDQRIPSNLTWIRASGSVPELLNHLADNISGFNLWIRRLRDAFYKNEGVQKLLDISSFLPGTLILTNAGYKLQAMVCRDDVQDPTIDELRELGYHTFETIGKLHRQRVIVSSENSAEYISSESGNYTIIRTISYRNSIVGRLALIMNGPEPNPAMSDCMNILSGAIARYLLDSQSIDYGSNAELGSLVADIIEGRVTDNVELEQRLKQVRLIARHYYHLMIVSLNHNNQADIIPWNYVISQLQYIFPYSNITTYNGDILLLIQKRQRKSRIHFNEEQLMNLLEQYDGYACMGNATEFMMSLPVVYNQSMGGLRIGSRLDPDKRIYYYEEYAMYQLVELAAGGEIQQLGSSSLAHLCNNEMIALVMYDERHGTDLTDILITYLACERNTTEAARKLYMHRNTIINKIHKIEQLIDRDLEDPNVRERLIFSGYVVNYMRKYRKEDILLLNRGKIKERGRNNF